MNNPERASFARDLLAYEAMGIVRYLLNHGLLPARTVAHARNIVDRYDTVNDEMHAAWAAEHGMDLPISVGGKALSGLAAALTKVLTPRDGDMA